MSLEVLERADCTNITAILEENCKQIDCEEA